LGVLSFGRGKGVTGGGGGALLMQDAADDAVGRLPAGSGWPGWAKTVVQWALARPTWYWVPASIPFLRLGETVYHAPTPPRHMPGIHQEVLLRLLPVAEREVERRRCNGSQLLERATRAPRVKPIAVSAGIAGYLRFPVLTNDRRFRSPDAQRLGVMPGYPCRLADLKILRPHVTNRNADFPGAQQLVEELVTFPTHGQLTTRDVDRLASLIG
jgi:perosamine synthetase